MAEVTITNTGPAVLDGWTLAFAFGGAQRIAASWNGPSTQSGAAVTLTPATWNRTLAAGGTATVGVIGSWRTSSTPPVSVACAG